MEYRAVFEAVLEILPEAPPGHGPFDLSVPGKLEGLFAEAGLSLLESGEADCPFNYSDFETFWRANIAAGPLQGVLQIVSEERLQGALRDAVEQFRLDSGGIQIQPNIFKYVVATS